MKKNDIEKILNSEFKNRIVTLDFKKKGDKYLLIEKDVYKYVRITTYDYYDVFPSQFAYGIGFLSIQKLLRTIIGGMYKNPENDFIPVLGIGQAELYESGDYDVLEYEIRKEEDILVMVNEVMNYLEKDALPYFESINTIEKIEPVVNASDNPRKGVTGLILAKLVGNPNYPQLKEKYRYLLKDWTEDEKEKLETAIRFLDNHTQEELQVIAIAKG